MEKKTYDVLSYGAVGDGKADDSKAFVRAWEDLCGASETYDVPTLQIPAGKTFLLQPTKFKGPYKSKGVHVQVLGKVVAPKTPDAWKQCESNYWLSFSNVANLRMNGGSGIIDGQGSSWWSNANEQKLYIDEKKKCQRPKALHFHGCHNLLLTGLTHVNSPKGHISISNCSYVYVANLTITAPEESPNTDGIDISNSNHVNIHASYIGTADDCIAINSGCSNINITNIACGPGHGISVGSLGENGAYATVENVSVKNCSFSRTQNGVRIKTWQGGSGYAKNITFEQITLHATKNPIIIDQYYCNGAHNCKNKTSAVKSKVVQ
ncbi:putative polygalacturonase [Rosa sericea]